MIMRLCRVPGCLAQIPPPRRYCQRHDGLEQQRLKTDADKATARWGTHHDAHPEWSAIYRDPRWIALRASHLKACRICARCGQPGLVVDHIVPHKGDEALAFDPSNLQTLCKACDAKKTARDRVR